MKAGINWVLVKVDGRLKEDISMGSQKLYLDPTYDIYRHTKITAEVIAVPERLAGTVLYEKSIGHPQPARNDPETGRRYPIKFQPEMATSADVTPEIRKGDIVYFHYLSLSKDHFMGKDGDMEIYKVGYQQLFCRVRDGVIYMLNGIIAVEAAWDESYEDVEFPDISITGHKTGSMRKLKVKQTGDGIIYDIDEKPVYRHGTVAHRGKAPDGVDYPYTTGDKVIYTDFSEFKNTIEGTEYYIMKLWDVIAVYDGGTIMPINEYVIIDAVALKPSILIIPEKYKKESDEGVVVAVGPQVNEVEVGNTVKYNLANIMYIDMDGFKGAFLLQRQIYMKTG